MNTVSYASFNENSKHYLENIAKTNNEILILKNSKPLFRISLVKNPESANILKGSIIFENDILSPIDDNWDSE